jgi:cell wall-associated NlpC family hydrolase
VNNLAEARRGDLIFMMGYKGTRKSAYEGINKAAQTISHVGIYMGDGKMLHTASQKTGGVRTDYIIGKQYEWRIVHIGRVLP